MKPILFMMVGLPGSGKSTKAEELKKIYEATIYSSDKIREELFNDINNQNDNELVFQRINVLIKSDLRNGKNVIHDATNINYKRRMDFISGLSDIECYKICVFMATPFTDCVKNNLLRARVVPVQVIDRMYKNIFIPQIYEGWDDIIIAWNYKCKEFSIDKLFDGANGLNFIEQDNPHHSMTIGKHCIKSKDIMLEIRGEAPFAVMEAALLHDIGKEYTKSFIDCKGMPSNTAHYYQHHLVSAYNSLFYTSWYSDSIRLLIANYIQWHMLLYSELSQKKVNKYKSLLGEEFYKNLELLHFADEMAK